MVTTKEEEPQISGHVDKCSTEVNGSNPESADDGHGDLPIDRGWASVILGASWINILLTIGMYRVSGIVFVEVQKVYNSSSSVTSLIPSFINVSFSVSAMLVNNVFLTYISVRQCVMTGAVVLFVTFVISAFIRTIELIVFLQGFLVGFSHAMVLPPTYSLISQYFNKRRGLSNCTMFTGACTGSIIFSFVIRKFVNLYALSGTFLLLGALSVHIVISGALMRPIETYKRVIKEPLPEKEPLTSNTEQRHTSEDTKAIKHTAQDSSKCGNNQTYLDNVLSEPRNDSENSIAMRSLLMKKVRTRTVSESAVKSVCGSITSLKNVSSLRNISKTEFSVSMPIIGIRDNEWDLLRNSYERINHSDQPEVKSASCTRGSAFFGRFGNIIDCSVIKRVLFLFYLLIACLLFSGCSMIQTFIPPHAKDIGISDEESDFLITLISIVETCSFLFCGIISDRNWIKKSNIIAITVITMGVVTFFVPFYDSYEMMVFFSVVYGISGRLYFPLFPVVLVELFGLENFRSSLSITLLFHSGFIAFSLPISGFLRDISGSYVHSFQLMATFLVVGGVGTACLPLVEKCERRRRQRSPNVTVRQ